MADILEKIIAYKRNEIADAVAKRPLATVEDAAHRAPPVRGFAAALQARIAAGRPALIAGINNRNLKTFATSLETTEELAPRVPKDRTVIAESGIASPADLQRLAKAGVHAFLVGESLMRQADVAAATRTLLGAGP